MSNKPEPKQIMIADNGKFKILPQPTDSTCGPTCLHAVYNFYNDTISLDQVIQEIPQLETGGTLACVLGHHALLRGYHARIYTLNLTVFDPSWFPCDAKKLMKNLQEQRKAKRNKKKLCVATDAYLAFLACGGEIRYDQLRSILFRKHLSRGQPLLTGLSATYLYNCAREIGDPSVYDAINGTPTGHFVTVYGYDKETRGVLVADPLQPNPLADKQQHYHISFTQLIGSILLGVLTYDANILVIWPKKERGKGKQNG